MTHALIGFVLYVVVCAFWFLIGLNCGAKIEAEAWDRYLRERDE